MRQASSFASFTFRRLKVEMKIYFHRLEIMKNSISKFYFILKGADQGVG